MTGELEKNLKAGLFWQTDEEKKARNVVILAKRQTKSYKEYHRQFTKQWTKRNPEKAYITSSKRRALKKQASVNLASIKQFVLSVKSKKTVKCYYCTRRVRSNSIHFDHIVPLSKGGAHSVDNLCVSCADCNLKKHDKTPQAWIKVGQQFLAL